MQYRWSKMQYFKVIRNTLLLRFGLVWFYCVERHFQQYFSYIVMVSFIDGGNRRTRRENHRPITSH
jgi:hypothetical protein